MKLVITPAALADLQAAATRYSMQASPDLGRAFVNEFERAVNLILANPSLGAIFRGTTRRFILRRFPYSIFYRRLPREVQVIAIGHHKRHPDFWKPN